MCKTNISSYSKLFTYIGYFNGGIVISISREDSSFSKGTL